ncbi:MAG: SWIM zinc finger family protein [Chloroflexota bacterium]|nr:SWIM zinc finger family protein [Chloroflexota bacterium]
MNVPDERNRNKLYDALASGALVFTGDMYPVADSILERCFSVESTSAPGTDYTVTLVQHWDLSSTWTCSCPWGQKQGSFGATHTPPCKHCLLVWYHTLPDQARIDLLRADAGLARATLAGAAPLRAARGARSPV